MRKLANEVFERLMERVNSMAEIRELGAKHEGFEADYLDAIAPAAALIAGRFEELEWMGEKVCLTGKS
jgi:hypothetical protein